MRRVQRLKREDSKREKGVEKYFLFVQSGFTSMLPASLRAIRDRPLCVEPIKPLGKPLWFVGDLDWKSSACAFAVKELTGVDPSRMAEPSGMRQAVEDGGKSCDGWWWLCQDAPDLSNGPTWCIFLRQEAAFAWAAAIRESEG